MSWISDMYFWNLWSLAGNTTCCQLHFWIFLFHTYCMLNYKAFVSAWHLDRPIVIWAAGTKATVSLSHVIDVMDNTSQRSLCLFFSCGRRITVILLLSKGAAGRSVSPIWSKNLVADLHVLEMHCNPTLTQMPEIRKEISVFTIKSPVIQFPVSQKQRCSSLSALKVFVRLSSQNFTVSVHISLS